MKLTTFDNLEAAIRLLGGTKVSVELIRSLELGTKDVRPEDVIVGDFGIYYLSDDGVLSRVVVHIVDKSLTGRYVKPELRTMVEREDYENDALVEDLHKYHLVRCNTLERAEREGWRDRYKMSNRKDGRFHYRFLEEKKVREVREDQRLYVCKLCLNDVIDTGYVNAGTDREHFEPQSFLTTADAHDLVGLEEQGEYAEHSLPNMYVDDWRLIARSLKQKKRFRCEGPNCPRRDLSDQSIQRYLHAHHVDMDKSHNRFSNLQALCIYCHANEPGHSHMKATPDYRRYLSMIQSALVA
jgi:hypothetical protein